MGHPAGDFPHYFGDSGLKNRFQPPPPPNECERFPLLAKNVRNGAPGSFLSGPALFNNYAVGCKLEVARVSSRVKTCLQVNAGVAILVTTLCNLMIGVRYEMIRWARASYGNRRIAGIRLRSFDLCDNEDGTSADYGVQKSMRRRVAGSAIRTY